MDTKVILKWNERTPSKEKLIQATHYQGLGEDEPQVIIQRAACPQCNAPYKVKSFSGRDRTFLMSHQDCIAISPQKFNGIPGVQFN